MPYLVVAQKGTSLKLVDDVLMVHFLLDALMQSHFEKTEQSNEVSWLPNAQGIVDLYLSVLNLQQRRQNAKDVRDQMGCNKNENNF